MESGIDLVYGGGSIGLMGIVCQAVHEGGRHVLGYKKFPHAHSSSFLEARSPPLFFPHGLVHDMWIGGCIFLILKLLLCSCLFPLVI